ncbi:hypothetical protein S40285_09832 [Stachybotrys chlorohalonatus IBT 40285]|uniref:Uncharacterized protein n=1 Tax=Stachybotrys chlorohalonatus (strain IBT 40285) TaxID=1283841 RepID=A0A084QU70_STAC4|nr:hypothetical protein S40285_09832 [Stachybotrys chlorohalonata IBT 40285]
MADCGSQLFCDYTSPVWCDGEREASIVDPHQDDGDDASTTAGERECAHSGYLFCSRNNCKPVKMMTCLTRQTPPRTTSDKQATRPVTFTAVGCHVVVKPGKAGSGSSNVYFVVATVHGPAAPQGGGWTYFEWVFQLVDWLQSKEPTARKEVRLKGNGPIGAKSRPAKIPQHALPQVPQGFDA